MRMMGHRDPITPTYGRGGARSRSPLRRPPRRNAAISEVEAGKPVAADLRFWSQAAPGFQGRSEVIWRARAKFRRDVRGARPEPGKYQLTAQSVDANRSREVWISTCVGKPAEADAMLSEIAGQSATGQGRDLRIRGRYKGLRFRELCRPRSR